MPSLRPALPHRRAPRAVLAAAMAAALVAAAAGPAAAQPSRLTRPDSGAFVTRLGADTLVVERFVRRGRRVDAEVVLRTPRTTRTRYALELTPAGELARMEATELDPRTGRPLAPARRDVITRVGDSLRVESTADGQPRVRTAAASADVLPFIDMVHWPYELVLQRARAANAAELTQPLLAGSRVAAFRVASLGTDSATITHPSRGTMRARVDARGRLLGLDAGATTRKLRVERVRWLDPAPFARRWAAADAAGRSLGALSGRGADTARVEGATVSVDHGQPAKRGREIWGALVPYGAVWRTGANEATHFTTSADLVLGAGADTLAVPAGRYTLFSIPAADGGVLIVNTQTGQAGTSYDPARDLGRVPLTRRALAAPAELFAIRVDEAAGGGLLRLQWDRSELVVPFRVRAR